METNSLAGEYYLHGVREMASGFLLQPDGNFQFFFTYGALDRFGSGHWEKKGNLVQFSGAARPSHDFALIRSKKVAGDQITIRIKDKNQILLNYVYVSLARGERDTWTPANRQGEIIFPKQEISTISLLFEFCPERFSTFGIENRTHNDFTFRFEPWFTDVFLNEFELRVDKNELTGRHPILEGEQFRYVRQ